MYAAAEAAGDEAPWYCHMNVGGLRRRCEDEEEQEDAPAGDGEPLHICEDCRKLLLLVMSKSCLRQRCEDDEEQEVGNAPADGGASLWCSVLTPVSALVLMLLF